MKDTLLWQLVTTIDFRRPALARVDWTDRLVSPFAGGKLFSPHPGTVDSPGKLLSILLERKGGNAPEKEVVWSMLFPKKKFKRSAFDNIVSDALERLYQQLAIYNFQSDSTREGISRTEQLARFGLEKQAMRQLKRANKFLEEQASRSYSYYQQQYELSSLGDQLALRQRRQQSQQLQLAVDALDQSYLINKLRLSCDMLSGERVVSGQFETQRLDFLLEEFRAELSDPQRYPIASLYYQVYCFLSSRKIEATDYQKTKALVQAYAHLLSGKEEMTVYSYLLNFCIGCINRGDHSYYAEVLGLYKLLLQRELLMENGYLSPWAYTNITTAGLRQRAFTWTEAFLSDYQQQLPPEARANTYQYNLASLEFERGDFDQALTELGEIAYTDAFYYISAKLIQLKVYYLQEAYGPLLSTAESTRLYLLRNRQLSDYQRRSIKAFLRCIQQLAQWRKELPFRKTEVSLKRQSKLLREIKEQQEIAQRDWLLARLEEKW